MSAREQQAQAEIKALKVELAKQQAKAQPPPAETASQSLILSLAVRKMNACDLVEPAKHAPKGASLANPNKKARKYREVEFASDDE